MRIVVVHHPLDVHDAGDLGDIVHGASEAVRAWARAGADLVLSGHVHVPLCRPLAVRYGPGDVARLLVQEGADPTLKNELGLTALDFARQADRADMVELIAQAVRRRQPSAGKW